MAGPPKNTCTPSGVFGGFDQTLFLGCSVMGFSASAGLNGQPSEITVQIVEDPCAPPPDKPKKYYNAFLVESDWTDEDPGFYGNISGVALAGTATYFRVGDFEFSGIVQGWRELNSVSEYPAYEVKLTSPDELIQNAQLIINDYGGSVEDLYNVFNIFGYLEKYGASCPEYSQLSPGLYVAGDLAPDGPVFGTISQAYGGADVNTNGMQWEQMKNGILVSTSTFPLIGDDWSPYGRIIFKGPGNGIPGERMGVLDVGDLTEYYLDLDEMPVPPTYWRFNGLTTGLADTIGQLCEDAGFDWTVQLLPVNKPVDDPQGGPTVPSLFINIKTFDRANEPTANSIDTFINSAKFQDRIVSYDRGEELRSDITQTLVIGGAKQSFYQAELQNGANVPNMIRPYFGLKENGDAIVPILDGNNYWNATLETGELQQALNKYSINIPTEITVNEREMMVAEAGYDMWSSYAGYFNTPLWAALGVDFGGAFNAQGFKDAIADLDAGRAVDVNELITSNLTIGNPDDLTLEIAQTAYSWIKKIVDEYYGVQFMVRVPFTCAKRDSVNNQILTSEVPTDGGWTEVTPILDLDYPSDEIDFFTLSDNRIGAFVRFDTLDIEASDIDPNDFVFNEQAQKLWLRCSVSGGSYVYEDQCLKTDPAAVISLPRKIRQNNTYGNIPVAYSLAAALMINPAEPAKAITIQQAENLTNTIFKGIGRSTLQEGGLNRPLMPDAAGFGIKSNVLTYGPWGTIPPPGDTPKAGKTNVTQDEGLVPWEYGGFDTMNTAGQDLADFGQSQMQVSEYGSITFAGYPDTELSSELLFSATGPYSDPDSSPHLVENRVPEVRNILVGRSVTTTDPCATPGGGIQVIQVGGVATQTMDGTYGPVITDVTTQVNSNQIQTTYRFRTWTPKFGLFSRGNSERLKQFGQRRLTEQKSIRAFIAQRLMPWIERANAPLLGPIRNAANLHRGNFSGNGHAPFLKNASNWMSRWSTPRTPHTLLMGAQYTWDTGNEYKFSSVESLPVSEFGVEAASDYNKKAVLSIDGLLRPVSINGDGDLPQLINPTAGTGTGNCVSLSRGSQPPIDKPDEAGDLKYYNLNITNPFLNPYANPSGGLSSRSDTPDHGHDIEIVGRNSSVPSGSMYLRRQGFQDTDDSNQSDYAEDYRFMAWKGPIVIQQYGYDLDGFPVPNIADDAGAAKSGNFTEDDLQHKFLDNFLRRSDTWPVAPLDIRLDRKRGVWTIPQYKPVVGELQVDIGPGENGKVIIDDSAHPNLYDSGGNIIESGEFLARDYTNSTHSSGDKVVCIFSPDACEYWILSGGTSAAKIWLADSGIPARAGSTLGSATCTKYNVTSGELVSANQSGLVYNMDDNNAVGSGSYIQAKIIDGIYVVDWEGCEA